jgi:hypothetical protein
MPTFNHNKFEESFSTWEFEVGGYERDNDTPFPEQVKIEVLMNKTTGPSSTPECRKKESKRRTSVATSERNRQRTRKEQRSQQPRERK